MIKSMTGYGRAEMETSHKKITIEIKSLNSKQLDINTRLPVPFREKDIEIRKILSEKLVRGKIDLNIFSESLGDDSSARINEPVLKAYFNQLKSLSHDLGIESNHETLLAALRLPDSVKTEYETLNDQEWALITTQLELALSEIDRFRKQEGTALFNDLKNNLNAILDFLSQIEPHEKQRIESIKSKLTDGLETLKLNSNMNQDRFEQELIFYLEKLDFNEEKVRLLNHCNYFTLTLNEAESNGKKLGFIAQEMGREINTIGSKANHSEIQRLVVQMKDNLERIKEQLLNVL